MEGTVSEKFEAAVKAAKGKIVKNLEPSDMLQATQAVLNITTARAQYNGQSDVDEELATALDRVRPNLIPVDMMKATQSVRNLVEAIVKTKPTRTKTAAV